MTKNGYSEASVAKAGEELSVGNIESCLENLSAADDLEKLHAGYDYSPISTRTSPCWT